MHTLDTINAFLEDTGLITAMAYLIARGRTLSGLFQRRTPVSDNIRLGTIFGLIAISELVLPNDRYPYVMDTLMTTVAALMGGPIVGVICASTVSIAALLIQPWHSWPHTAVAVFLCVAVCNPFRRVEERHYNPFVGMVFGMLTQLTVLAAEYLYSPVSGGDINFTKSLVSVFANGFAMILITIVINDAWQRINSERYRLDAERASALAAKAELNALRARIHPHFLYNVLASIAGMCAQSPSAEHATIQLSKLMRRTLDASAANTIPLSTELEHVKIYLDIEQQRLGPRLTVNWDIDKNCPDVTIPPLALQTLVENAVNHGIAPQIEPGVITISTRAYDRFVLLAVSDNGDGMPLAVRRQIGASETQEAVHGMQILSKQLVLLFGRYGRLRIFSKPNSGTLVAFTVPNNQLKDRTGIGS